MRIAVVCYPTFGGSGVVATELACALCRRGYEVELVSYDLPFRLPVACPQLHWHQVTWFNYPLMEFPPYDLALANLLVRLAETKPLSIIHVHYAIPHAISAYLACQVLKDRAPKVITTLHGTDITLVGSDPSYREITRFALRESHRVTAVSQYLKEKTYEKLGSNMPVEVIPNFLDLHRFPFRRPPRKDPFTLVHISNFRPVKNTLVLPRILKALLQYGSFRLLLIGEGPDLPGVLAEGEKFGVRDRVECVGAVPHVEHVLAQGDVLIHPSLEESFGLSLLEAMALGVVPVASRVGGIPEVVVDGETGLLVQPEEEEAFVEAILKVYSNPDLHNAMADAGRKRVEAHFSEDTILPQYEALYQSI